MGRPAALPDDQKDNDSTADTAGEEANAENTEANDTPQVACVFAILLRLAHVSVTAASLAMVAACALTAVRVRFAWPPVAAFRRRADVPASKSSEFGC